MPRTNAHRRPFFVVKEKRKSWFRVNQSRMQDIVSDYDKDQNETCNYLFYKGDPREVG